MKKKKIGKLDKKLIKEAMRSNLTLLEKGTIVHLIVLTDFKKMMI